MADRMLTRRRVARATAAALVAGIAGCSGTTPGTETETGTETGTDRPTDTAAATDTPAGTTTENASETSRTSTDQGMAGPRDGDDLPPDPKPDDGYPPKFDRRPDRRSVDTSQYETLTRETPSGQSVEVPLIPIEDAYYWYARRKARFVDARSETGYEVAHIFGSVLSPAPDGRPVDPTDDWNEGATIVTYCHCPHHLSSLRAAGLIEAGFTDVYAIDEGFQAWLDRNYPLAGADTSRDYTVRTIEGRTDPADAGETAWAVHRPTDQIEATEVESDGSYSLELKFVEVDADSTITVETPSYTVAASLETVTSETVTAQTGQEVARVTNSTGTAANGTASNTTTDSTYGVSWPGR